MKIEAGKAGSNEMEVWWEVEWGGGVRGLREQDEWRVQVTEIDLLSYKSHRLLQE